ncbi:hypothetical protein BLNAU_20781 [Blattamonas nauphoetae]|uniref:Uncharacterized protein n=1 Tax=Blattamonas nauphoetae TaxID=2049346 RepID=A0ABQ9WXP2_9EUKA|nr:hypothetical protein BLNAU_20781 [Blattamonas nauphoetae]
MEGAKTADHCEGALEDLRFVLIDHHKLRQEIWTRPARDMLRPFQTFKQFIAQPKVRNIDLKAAKKKEFLDKIASYLPSR